MDGMHHGHMHGMDAMAGMHHGHMQGMNATAAPPPMNHTGSSGMHNMHPHKMTMMHMTFFWGKNAEILFSGWPGTNTGMYILSLVFVFVLSVLVEWLSHSKLIKPDSSNVVAGLAQTAMHCLRVGLAYMVMLAVMSFNVGVFLVAVVGHTVGFLLFGSRVFKKPSSSQIKSDLPPMSC